MFFFIDESWQLSEDKRHKAGVLSAIPMRSRDFNGFSVDAYNVKKKHLGFQGAGLELKGHKLFQRFYFRLEKKGIASMQLNLARDLFSLCESRGIKAFATITFPEHEHDLACANPEQLERPFFYLFERINQFMLEEHPGFVATLVFDDRGVSTNQRISKSISNFFHKSQTGRTFEKILKVPFFAISSENVGIQIADLFGHIIGRRFTGDKEITTEFFQRVKAMQYESREVVEKLSSGQEIKRRGIKVIKDKHAATGSATGEEI